MSMSTTSSTARSNSRFSTLNVFKFASSSSSKPPPPPPKDPYYLANPSLLSLNQSSLSVDKLASHPTTPMSAGYPYAASTRSPSPSPSYSNSQYASSRVNLSPSPSSSLSPDSAGSRKGIFKLPSFTKRPKTPKSVKSPTPNDVQPPEPQDDASISTPWNFQVCSYALFPIINSHPMLQHNIHVDEGYVSFTLLSSMDGK